MTAPALLCAGLEIALNRYLALEPAVAERCGALAGKVIGLRADGPGWEFFVLPRAGGVQVLGEFERKPDVRVIATPVQLFKQALRAGRGDKSVVDGVQVEGDVGLLSRFGALLVEVGFEPEEWLASVLGGGAAHRAVGGARSLADWARGAAGTLGLDTAEYLREETRDLVHKDDINTWADAVDKLDQRVRALGERIQRAERA